MRSPYPLLACLSFLTLQTNLAACADAAVAGGDATGSETEAPSSTAQRRIVAHGVDFQPNTANISPDALPVLDEALELLGSNGPVVVVVDGSAHNGHSDVFENLLARRRAKAVRRYLIDHGVPAHRITLPPDVTGTIATNDSPPHSQPLELHLH